MTPREHFEESTVRKGFASIAVKDGASEGQVLAVDAAGHAAFVDQSGGGSGLHGFMGNAIQFFDGVPASWGENTEPRWFSIFDTDGFVAAGGGTPDYLDQIAIPAGLDGMYQLEAVIYIVENESDPGLTQATFILNDPTNNGDFDVRPSLLQEFVGSVAITRPLLEGDQVQVKLANIAGASSLVMKGGEWLTDPDNPDGPGLLTPTIQFSLFTVTRIGPLPLGFTRPY
jgi:hypothetical protein